MERFLSVLGACLLPFSVTSLGFGFQSFYVWKDNSLATLLWVVAGIFFVAGVISFVISGRLYWRKDHPYIETIK